MDNLIPGRRLDLKLIYKKERICPQVDFAVPADYRVKLKESEKVDKYQDLARQLKKNKTEEYEVCGDKNYSWRVWNGP